MQTGIQADRIDRGGKEGGGRRIGRSMYVGGSWTELELLNHLFRRRDPESDRRTDGRGRTRWTGTRTGGHTATPQPTRGKYAIRRLRPTDRPTIHLMSQEGQGGRPAVEGPVPQKMVAFETKDRSLKISEMLTMHVRHLFCWP